MIAENQRICPICDNIGRIRVLKNIYLGDLRGFALPNTYEIVSCEKCGFCYANTKATLDDYDYYYKNYNIYSGSPHKAIRDKGDFCHINDIIKRYLSYDSRILDIGCGYGNFIIEARKNGYNNIFAIDPSSESIEHIRNQNFNGFIGNVYDEPISELKSNMDAVFIMDVLEHLLEPKKGIKQAIKYLKGDGKLFIQVPNYGRIKENLTPISNNFNHEHINYFSNKSLKNLLAEFNFKEIFSEYRYNHNNFKESVLFSVYSKDERNIGIEKDETTETSILEYLKKQSKQDKLRMNKIDDIKNSNEKVYVWGVGSFVRNLLTNTSLGQCNIIAFIDNNPLKTGKLFNEKKILSPESLKNTDGTIVITSMLYGEDIKMQIKNMNLKNKVILLD